MAVLVLDTDDGMQVVICPDSYADQSYRTVVEVPEEKKAWAERVEQEWNEVQEYLQEVLADHYRKRGTR